jgi:hypothetical protein
MIKKNNGKKHAITEICQGFLKLITIRKNAVSPYLYINWQLVHRNH